LITLALVPALPTLGGAAAAAQSLSYAEHCERAGRGQLNGTYLNARYGYLLHYESGWHRLQIGGNEQSFQLLCQTRVAASGEVIDTSRFGPLLGVDPDSLSEVAIRVAASACGADGPDGGSTCEPATEVEILRSPQGLRVFRFYQTLVREDYVAEETTRQVIGPYYAIDISQRGINRLLLLNEGLASEASEESEVMIRAMVDALEVIDSPFLSE
jgi:hypothetical protein